MQLQTDLLKSYGALGVEKTWLGVFLFTRVTTTIFPSRTSYTTKKLKQFVKKDEHRDFAYIPHDNFDTQCVVALQKLKELNFNLDYGLARDSMRYLKSKGLIWI